jgi:hypothetical protein
VEEENMYSMDLKYASRHVINDPLLSIRVRGNDTSSFEVTTPARPLSSSPSRTYPIRIAIIHIIAPIAVFVNDYLGDAIGFLFSTIFTAVEVLFIVLVYVFIILAIVVSIYRCVGGPSLEATVQRVHEHLETLKENERLRFLHIEAIQEGLDRLYHNERIRVVVDVCRNGWHPEREREREAQQEEADIESGSSSLEEQTVTGKGGSSKKASAPTLA